MRKSNRRKKTQINKNELKFNEAIRAPIVSVIDEEGNNAGEMNIRDALIFARERHYDLVEVSPKANPPVVKLIDYGEYKYKKEKQEQKNKARQKKTDIKGIRLSIRISAHDLDFRKKRAMEFLEEGHKVKIELSLKGRERQHFDLAYGIINEFIKSLGETIALEQNPQRQGGIITAIITKK